MRFPSHLLQTATFRSEPLLAAMAAIAVGMFVGTWIIGPAVTRDSADAPAPAAQQRTTFEDLVARPDPMPYRAPTPVFDTSGQPSYAAAAKQKGAGRGGRTVRGRCFDSGSTKGLAMVLAQFQLPVIRPAQGQLAPRGSFRPGYSGLMPASLTIGAHFSASMRKSAASSAGVDGLTGAPIAS